MDDTFDFNTRISWIRRQRRNATIRGPPVTFSGRPSPRLKNNLIRP